MSILYLTPASISYLTQFILAAAIAGNFWYQPRRQSAKRESNTLATLLLAAAFTSFACATLLLFLNASLRPDLTFYAMPLESVAVALFLAFLLQFAYHFPSPVPDQKWEARVVLGLAILYLFAESRIAIHRYAVLAQGHVAYGPQAADLPLLVGFLWVAVVLLRQTMRTSTDAPGVTAWRKLWRPRGRAARAARALALLSILPLGFEAIELLQAYLLLPHDLTDLIQSLGILFALSAFTLVYLNYLPETTSLQVKLVGIGLATLLAVLGSVGWIVKPSVVAAYHNDAFITDKTTLRFAPNTRGGYDVTAVPFHFDSAFGTELAAGGGRTELGFDFPFYDQVWREAYILEDGVISFRQALSSQDVKYRYGPRAGDLPAPSGPDARHR